MPHQDLNGRCPATSKMFVGFLHLTLFHLLVVPVDAMYWFTSLRMLTEYQQLRSYVQTVDLSTLKPLSKSVLCICDKCCITCSLVNTVLSRHHHLCMAEKRSVEVVCSVMQPCRRLFKFIMLFLSIQCIIDVEVEVEEDGVVGVEDVVDEDQKARWHS